MRLLLTAADYILKLRRSMTNIQRSQNYIESVAFWKQACADVEAAQTVLREKLFEAEVQNRDLRGNIKDTVTLTPENASQRKRKRESIASVSSQSRKAQEHARAAEGSTLASKVEAKTNLIMGELEVLISARTGKVHHENLRNDLLLNLLANLQMQHLHTLQQLTARKIPNPKDLASILVQLISVIGQALWESKNVHPQETGKATTSVINATRGQITKATNIQSKAAEDQDIMLRIIYRTFVYILKGLDKLAVVAEGATLQGQVIYDIVKLFRESLDFIATYDSVGPSKKAPQKGGSRTKEAVPNTFHALCLDESRQRISRLLVMLIASLNPTEGTPNSGAHQQIFEGFLYVLFEKVGQVLRLFVFGNSEYEGASPILGSGGSNEQDEKLATAKASAPSLIWILERAIILFDRNMQHAKTPDAGMQGDEGPAIVPPKESRLPTANVKLNLVEGAKRKLQHTLLKGFFGADNEEFLGALQGLKDPKLDLEREFAVLNDDDVVDWFKHELERLVGWDVLKGCIAWDGGEAI